MDYLFTLYASLGIIMFLGTAWGFHKHIDTGSDAADILLWMMCLTAGIPFFIFIPAFVAKGIWILLGL